MGGARPLDLLRIAESDPAPRVAGQALLTLTASSAWKPASRDLEQVLQTLIAGGDPGTGQHRDPQDPWLAANLAGRARAAGNGHYLEQTVGFLSSVVVDPRLQVGERRQALDALRPYVPQHEHDALASGL